MTGAELRGRGRPTTAARTAEEIAALRSLEEAFRAADAARKATLEARNVGVREALDAGWTHAQIAEATGLSRGRISQIKPNKTSKALAELAGAVRCYSEGDLPAEDRLDAALDAADRITRH